MQKNFILIPLALYLSACDTNSPTDLDKKIFQNTMMVSTVASHARLCGDVEKADAYAESYISHLRSVRTLDKEQETEIRSWLGRGDTVTRRNFGSDNAAIRHYCTVYPVDQTQLDTGIAGNFDHLPYH